MASLAPFSELSPISYGLQWWELEKRKSALAEMDHQLQRKSLEFRATQRRFENELNALRARHYKINETLPLILQYIKGLHDEFKKFEERAKGSDEKIENGLKEKECLQKEFVGLKEMEKRTQSELNSYSVFKTFLESVCNESNGKFKSIPDLLEEFTLVIGNRETMLKRIHNAENQKQAKQQYLNQYTADAEAEILKLRNQIRSLTQQQEKLIMELTDLSSALSNAHTNTSNQIMMVGSSQTAISNLYVEVCRKLRLPAKIQCNDSIGQLTFLESALQDLKELVKRTQNAVTIPDSNVVVN